MLKKKVVNGLGEVPVGSIPTNNQKKAFLMPLATTYSLKETYRLKISPFRSRPYKIKKKER
jgi:hypothetical protein